MNVNVKRVLSAIVLSFVLVSVVGQFLNVDFKTEALGLDPNFGYETIGANDATISSSSYERIIGSVFTITEDGTADSITVALKRAVAGSNNVKCAIYKHSDSSLLGSTQQVLSSMTTSYQWFTFNFTNPKPSLTTNTEYCLEVWADYTDSNIYLAGDVGATNQGHYSQSYVYDSFPNSIVFGHSSMKYSIYCTYTTGDSTKPTYSNIGTNTTKAGKPCLFYTRWTDNINMSGYIFGTNNTGSWVNDTWAGWSPVGTPKWSNVTKTLTSTVGIKVQWQIWANDTSNNWNSTGAQSFITIPVSGDTTSPTYWSTTVSVNTTRTGHPCLFQTLWIDNVGLSGLIFGTNNTGSWQNDTWTDPWTGTPTSGWSNRVKTLNTTAGLMIQWRIWANDTSNNWNSTGIRSFMTTPGNRFVDPTLGYPLTGALTFTVGSRKVTGVGTKFTTEICPYGVDPKDYCGLYPCIKPDGKDEWRSVSSVTNDTQLWMGGSYGSTFSATAKINKNNGTSAQFAVAHLVQLVEDQTRESGDIIYVRRNTTHRRHGQDATMYPKGNGEEDQPITIMGDDGTGWPNETGLPKPIFDYFDSINFQNKIYWVFKDFEFINHYEAMGPIRTDNSSYITFENADFHHNYKAGYAVTIYTSSNVLFKNCKFYDNENSSYGGQDVKIHGFSTVQFENCAFDTSEEFHYPWSIVLYTAPSTLYIRDTTFGATYPHTSYDIQAFFEAVGSIVYIHNVTFTSGVKNVEVRNWIEIPPSYSNIGTSTTLAGNSTTFHVFWQDDVGLSGFIFGTNNTGPWQNETWSDPWTGTPTSGWSNVTKTLNSTVGVTVKFQFWCNNTNGIWATTGTQFIITSSGNITIEIDEISITSLRVNVGTTVTIYFHSRYNNQSTCTTGTIAVNGTNRNINSTGWAFLSVSFSIVTKKVYTVTSVNVSGETDYQQIPSNPQIIWDRMEVFDNGVSSGRTDVGSTVIYWWKLRYDYDDVVFDATKGSVSIGGEYASWSSTAQRWEREVTLPSTPQNYLQSITFSDSTYGLTEVTGTISRSVIADKLLVTFSANNTAPWVGQSVTISWVIERQFDISTVTSFIIDVSRDGVLWKEGLTNSSVTDCFSNAGTHTYDVHVSSVLDKTYGLTSFDSSGISVAWGLEVSPPSPPSTRYYSLTITVVDSDGVPLSDVRVSVTGKATASKVTDADGIAKFSLVSGSYMVYAESLLGKAERYVDLNKNMEITLTLETKKPWWQPPLEIPSAEEFVETVKAGGSAFISWLLANLVATVVALFGIGLVWFGNEEDSKGAMIVGFVIIAAVVIVFFVPSLITWMTF